MTRPLNPCPRCKSFSVAWDGLGKPDHWVCGCCRLSFVWLTQGYRAFVDDANWERVARHKWHIKVNQSGKLYARRDPHDKRQFAYLHHFVRGTDLMTDHEDGDGLNNQTHNLRDASDAQNQYNRGLNVKTRSSRFKGVVRFRGTKWQASIQKDGKRKYLGLYEDDFDAATAYNFAALELFGEFARYNTPCL